MTTPTYDLLASTTLSSAASSVQFSSLTTLASGYRDLIISADIGDTNSDYVYVQVNGDTSTNYSDVTIENTQAQQRQRVLNKIPISWSGTTVAPGQRTHLQFYIFNFATTTIQKTFLQRAGYSGSKTIFGVSKWHSNAAMQSIRFAHDGSGNFIAGSTFNLYGVVA